MNIRAAIAIFTLGLPLTFSGCGSDTVPPLDFDKQFGQITHELRAMTETLQAVPDAYKLDTQKDRQLADQMLKDAAKQLEEHAIRYQKARETLNQAHHLTGELSDDTLKDNFEAAKAFQAEVQRLMRNRIAYFRLSQIIQMVEAATTA